MGKINFREMSKSRPGEQFGKMDIERVGLFTDPAGLPGKWCPPGKVGLVFKGRQMMGVFPKEKCGTQDGYFDSQFKRIFIKEAIVRKAKPKPPKEGDKQPFCNPTLIPVGPTKQHSTLGDAYGCFDKPTCFENRFRKRKPAPHEPANPSIRAPGYFSKFPEYKPQGTPPKRKVNKKQFQQPATVLGHYGDAYFWKNPYDEGPVKKQVYVRPKDVRLKNPIIRPKWIVYSPGKLLGGCKAGGFGKWPEYKPHKYWPPQKKIVDGRNYYPLSYSYKSMYTTPIMKHNVDLRVNCTNFMKVTPNHVARYIPAEKI